MAEKPRAGKEPDTRGPLEGPEWSRDAPGADPAKNLPRWEGSIRFSESGDENADGDVSPETADYVATGGNRKRLSAAERAASYQRPLGTPPSVTAEQPTPEAWDHYGLGRPGHLSEERRAERDRQQEAAR